MMTPRQRVQAALRHREPDRIPFDLGGTTVTSITLDAYKALRKKLAFPEDRIIIKDRIQGLPEVDEDVLLYLEVDTRSLTLDAIEQPKILEDGSYNTFTDEWGARLRSPKEGGLYYDWFEFPIKEPTQETLVKYRWPISAESKQWNELRKRARELHDKGNYAIVGSCLSGGGIFEQMACLRGMEESLIDLMWHPSFAEQLMDRITDLYIETAYHFLDAVGDYMDVFVYWDDLATQQRPMISPEIFRRLIKPREARFVDYVKRHTSAKFFWHTCGAVRALIPDLIEIGVDILNPVQVSANGMNPFELKRDFGQELTFWGGGCDTQWVLPFGNPEQVRDEVHRRIDALARDGGFVFSAVHNIQADVPAENVLAMWEALREFGNYS